MKKMFGIILMLLVLGLFCGVSMAADKCADPTDFAPSLVMSEMTGDTVIDVVLVALGTEWPDDPDDKYAGSVIAEKGAAPITEKGSSLGVLASGSFNEERDTGLPTWTIDRMKYLLKA